MPFEILKFEVGENVAIGLETIRTQVSPKAYVVRLVTTDLARRAARAVVPGRSSIDCRALLAVVGEWVKAHDLGEAWVEFQGVEAFVRATTAAGQVVRIQITTDDVEVEL